MSNDGDLKALYPFLHGQPQAQAKLGGDHVIRDGECILGTNGCGAVVMRFTQPKSLARRPDHAPSR